MTEIDQITIEEQLTILFKELDKLKSETERLQEKLKQYE